MRWRLHREPVAVHPMVGSTFGHVARFHRIRLGLAKGHRTDALSVAEVFGREGGGAPRPALRAEAFRGAANFSSLAFFLAS